MSNIGNIIDHSKLAAVESHLDDVELKMEVYHKRLGILEALGTALLGGVNKDGILVPGFINEAKPWIAYCSECKKEKEDREKEAKTEKRTVVRGFWVYAVEIVIGIVIVGFVSTVTKRLDQIETIYKSQNATTISSQERSR